MEKALFYKNIILKHKMSVLKSRADADISTIIAGKRVSCPVFCSNMPSVQTYDIVKQFDNRGWFHVWNRDVGDYENGFNVKHYLALATQDKLNFKSISIGIKDQDIHLLEWILDKGYELDSITIDLALIYNIHFEEKLKWIRKMFPKTFLIAGNCDSYEAVKWVENLGVDCAKIFVGVSSACRTREFSGFGSSTVTDLINIQRQGIVYREPYQIPQGCCDRHEIPKPLKIKILNDGGMTVGNDGQVWLGDAAKAICLGASYVMSGKIFANCIDSPALLNGYSGNSTARIKGHNNHVEGATVNVQSNGLKIVEMMKLIEDSLRSSVSYAGGTNLEALKTCGYQIIS